MQYQATEASADSIATNPVRQKRRLIRRSAVVGRKVAAMVEGEGVVVAMVVRLFCSLLGCAWF